MSGKIIDNVTGRQELTYETPWNLRSSIVQSQKSETDMGRGKCMRKIMKVNSTEISTP